MKLIDLRSDTVTKPDKNIIEEALQAELGDDEYGEDPTVNNLQEKAGSLPDPNDRASQESEFGLELKTRDRERKLLRKIIKVQ